MASEGDSPEPDPSLPAFIVQTALDHLDEGFMLIDRDDRIRLWNSAYLDMLELPPALFELGADVLPMIRLLADRGDFGPGDPAELVAAIAGDVRSRKNAQGERQMANGKIIQVEWFAVPDGHFMFRLRDVTSDRNASRFKDELIATVSHELRTPLTAIIGALGLLRAQVGDQIEGRSAELLDMAGRNGERLTRLVNDLLDIDKFQADSLDFQFAPTEMRELLAVSVDQNLPYAQSLGIAIELEVPGETVTAEIDRDRILQVMGNLLSNAAKFSPPGSEVRVILTRGTDSARISVIDRGRGMSPEFCRRLFTRFAQENRSAPRGESGTGLGLAICKSITDRHHGQIIVDTREGAGTIFHVDLPYRQS